MADDKKTKKTFFENVISGKQHFYICPHVPVEIISFFIPDFLVEVSNQQKLAKKVHSFYNTVSLKKSHSVYKPQHTWDWK